MIGAIGTAGLVAALVVTLGGIAANAQAARGFDPRWAAAGRRAAYVVFILLSLAVAAMQVALVTDDFSIRYVAMNSMSDAPLWIKVVSLWAALEGSILLWGWMLAGFAAVVAWRYRDEHRGIMPAVNATMLAATAFFLLVMVVPANPFTPISPIPADGRGANPLLQNHFMMLFHPPIIYLGFVGMTVPFAFAIGTLLAGNVRTAWTKVTRTWMLVGWIFLTIGIILGAWWSYEVLGWGGYWAWDPVENASFMPWLTATAYIHSVLLQERRRMLTRWNLGLIIATFALTILGTFITRSGVIESVHAFTQSAIGGYFLAFFAAILIVGIGLLAARGPSLQAHEDHQLESAFSKEGAFLLNNLLFVAFCATVLIGTLYPLLAEAIRGVQVSVGAPFFDEMAVPFSLALILLMGLAPFIAYRKGDPRLLLRRLRGPLLLGLATGGITAVVFGAPFAAALTYGAGALVIAGALTELVSIVRTRAISLGESPLAALAGGFSANRRRFGGLTAHVGVVLLAIGVAASSSARIETEVSLHPGEQLSVGPYLVTYVGPEERREPHRDVLAAQLELYRDELYLGTFAPAFHFYPLLRQPIATPAVREHPLQDVYLRVMAFNPDGTATINARVNPLVWWIWFGSFVIAAGAGLSVWPLRREQRQAAMARQPGVAD